MDNTINNYRYYNPLRVVKEGEVVITTKNPSKRFYRACADVDKRKYVLAGVLVKGSAELCSMDVTKKTDLEAFIDAVSGCFFFFPAGGIVYKLPVERATELTDRYKQVKVSVGKARTILNHAGMELTGGIITSMSFSPRGEL